MIWRGAFVSETEKAFLPQFELFHATSGEEACEMVKAGQDRNAPFAMAYVDVRMPPGTDGIETVRRIRKFEQNLEIVIMTAYSDKTLPEIVNDMQLLHKLLYIRKPFSREEIQQITLALVGKWNIEQELAKEPAATRGQSAKTRSRARRDRRCHRHVRCRRPPAGCESGI